MIKFGIKSAIFGTAVYYSIEKGVWKDSKTTTALYEELERGMSPYVGELKSKVPFELPTLPQTEGRVAYLFKYYWNCGVKSTFRFLADLPAHATDLSFSAYESIVRTLETMESPTSQEKVEK